MLKNKDDKRLRLKTKNMKEIISILVDSSMIKKMI